MNSIFTKIINRELPANIVYEDDNVIAFLDINPVNPGHTLVVPKNEKSNMLESLEEDVINILKVVRTLAPAILKTVGADGFNLITNVGEGSGQTVFHTHFHIIPRFNNDGHKQWTVMEVTSDELNKIEKDIKSNI